MKRNLKIKKKGKQIASKPKYLQSSLLRYVLLKIYFDMNLIITEYYIKMNELL